MNRRTSGFTLVELVIGMVALGIACTSVLGILASQTAAYRDPIYRQTGIQIAKKVRQELRTVRFDEKSDPSGGLWRCGEEIDGIGLGDCSQTSKFGRDGSETAYIYDLDDFDDFKSSELCKSVAGCADGDFLPASFFYPESSSDQELAEALEGYFVRIEISAQSVPTAGGTEDILFSSGENASEGKLARFTVRQRDGTEVEYSVFMANI